MKIPRIKPPLTVKELALQIICENEFDVQWADATEEQREWCRNWDRESEEFVKTKKWPTHLVGKARH